MSRATDNPTDGPTSVEGFDAAAEDFKLLGDATRLKVFWLLCHDELSVAGIADAMGMSSPAISHHLRALRDTGVVVARRDGREVLYRAADGTRVDLLHHIVELVLEIECPRSRGNCASGR